MGSLTSFGAGQNEAERTDLLRTVFGVDSPLHSDSGEFWRYYKHEIGIATNEEHFNGRSGLLSKIDNQSQFMDLIRCLQNNTWLIRADMRVLFRNQLSSPQASDSDVDRIIDLALRIWTMINFRDPADFGLGAGRPCICWFEKDTLTDCLQRLFQVSLKLTLEPLRLSPRFTAAVLVSIGGLTIRWTSSLEDHLRYEPEHRSLWVFTYTEVLNSRARSPSSRSQEVEIKSPWELLLDEGGTQRVTVSPTHKPTLPLPAALFEETNRTLELLFPSWDPDTIRLLESMKMSFHSKLPRQRSLDLNDYPYWSDRLHLLYEEVFEAGAEGWTGLWRDRRDPMAWGNFWMTFSVLFLAVVTTVTSIAQLVASVVQTWATLKSMNYH